MGAPRITSYNVCYTKLLRGLFCPLLDILQHMLMGQLTFLFNQIDNALDPFLEGLHLALLGLLLQKRRLRAQRR